ncbi:MAG: tetratricopeptide repeat protein [Planctomycetota bacterium]
MVLDFRHPEERLERAIARFHRGEIGPAEQELRDLEQIGFRCVEVYLYLGHCSLDNGRMGEALGWYRKARILGRDRPEVILGLAVLAARRLHFERAIRLLYRATELRPEMQEAFDNLILCEAAVGRQDRALAAFQRSLEIDPRSPHAFFNAAFVHFEQGDSARARELWLRVLELADGYPDTARMVANCDRMLGNLRPARKRLEALLEEFPRDVDALADLGLVHEARDEWQSAARVYGRALEIDPCFARVRARLGALLRKNGRSKEGAEHLMRAGADDPTDLEVAMPLADALREAGRPGEAVAALRRPVREFADEAAPRVARARFLEAGGQWARAAAEYSRAHALDPEEPSHVSALARALINAGALERATTLLGLALDRYEGARDPYRLLAVLAVARGEPERAARWLETGLKRFPRDPSLTVGLAESYLRLGRIPRAIALADRARRSDEVKAESLDVLGRAYLALGDHRRAMEQARALLADEPDDARGIYLRGRALLLGGNAEAAAQDLRSYVRSTPHDPDGYSDLARCLNRLGRQEDARTQKRIGEFVARGAHL